MEMSPAAPLRVYSVLAKDGLLKMQVGEKGEWNESVKDTPENAQTIIDAKTAGMVHRFFGMEFSFSDFTTLHGI
jgi:hypothetical protein